MDLRLIVTKLQIWIVAVKSSDLISKVILCLWFLSMTIKRSKMGNWAAHPAFPQLFIAPRTIFTQVCTVNSVLKISIANWLNENCSITFFFRDANNLNNWILFGIVLNQIVLPKSLNPHILASFKSYFSMSWNHFKFHHIPFSPSYFMTS